MKLAEHLLGWVEEIFLYRETCFGLAHLLHLSIWISIKVEILGFIDIFLDIELSAILILWFPHVPMVSGFRLEDNLDGVTNFRGMQLYMIQSYII